MAPPTRIERRSLLPLGSLAFALAACGPAASDDPWAGVANAERDSTGVAIMESAAPLWTERDAWRVEPWPIVSIEALPGADVDPPRRVVDAARLSDGRVVIVDAVQEEVRFFDADGRPMSSVSARALGLPQPAALTGLVRIRGDSLSVFAGGGGGYFGRVGPQGEPGEPFAVSWGGLGGTDPRRYRPAGSLAQGAILLVPESFAESAGSGPGVSELTAPNLVVSALGEVTGAWGDRASVAVFTDGAITRMPLGRRTHHHVQEGRLYQAHGQVREVKVFGPDGGLERIVRRIDPPRRLTSAYWADELDRLAVLSAGAQDPDSGASPAEVAEWRARYARAPRPDRFPSSGAVRVDPSGRVWMQEYVRPGTFDPQTWSVFDPEGRWLGQVSVTAGMEVFEIGEDYILGVIADPLGVERVQLLQIAKPDPGDAPE